MYDTSRLIVGYEDEILNPTYILPTSNFKFKLANIREGSDGTKKFEDIKIPSEKFKWSIQESKLATIQNDGVLSSQLKTGRAEIVVVDQ